MLAVAALERQGVAVFETERVWDLAFEGADLCGVVFRGGAGANAMFPGVEPQAFGEADGVGSWYGRAETLDRGKDLLVEVPLYIGF